VLFEGAYFWLSGTPQIVAYLAGGVMLVTGASRFCPVYKLSGMGPSAASCNRIPQLWIRVAANLILVAAVLGGSYASAVYSRKYFWKTSMP